MKHTKLSSLFLFALTLAACGRDAASRNNTSQTDVASSAATSGTTSTNGHTGSGTNDGTTGGSTATGSTTSGNTANGNAPDANTSNANTVSASPTPTPTPSTTSLDPDTCTVVPANELMVTQTSVVEDAVRTTWTGATTNAQDGAWAIGRVLSRLSGAPNAGPYVNSLLNGLTDDDSFIASGWPQSGGAFTLTGTPLVLDAIVNRIDLRDPSTGSMGELRFVFGTNVPGSNLDGKIIVEIEVLASSQFSTLSWAQAWHHLSNTTLTPAQFNAALQVLTDYALDNAGSHYRVRTANETPLQPWTFRQFEPQGGVLVPANLGLTPAARFDKLSLDDPNSYFGQAKNIQQSQIIDPNDRAELLSFVAGIGTVNIATGNYGIPAGMGAPSFQMQRFYQFEVNQVNQVVTDESWSIPSVSSIASATFSVNTCNGCHGLALALGPSPAQVGHRVTGLPSPLADFLQGTSEGKFNDLQRRAADMSNILCGNGATVAGAKVVIPNN